MSKAVDAAVKSIAANSQKVNGTQDIARVAAVSSSDEEIGKLIAEAMEKVSTDGVITVEESKTAETYSEVVEGMQFDRGYVTPYMVTDTEKMEAVLDGTVYPDRQPSARHLYLRCSQGARLWRPPQGNASGYRNPDRRHGHFRGYRY